MIPLAVAAIAEARAPYVTRLCAKDISDPVTDSVLVSDDERGASFSGLAGLLSIEGLGAADVDGDVVLVQPDNNRVERLLRRGSRHNTLLVTERCDQLCVMCSQPPKKTHVDRFVLLEQACMLAEANILIGITGGEPTLYKDQLFSLVERVGVARPDVQFHILTNGQHFADSDIERLRQNQFSKVSWGIPLYSFDATQHDEIVGKRGAFERLHHSLNVLLLAGARVELRTVVLSTNIRDLPKLARYVTAQLRFIESWSIMQLERTGFAKNRWTQLFFDHRHDFEPIAQALDHMIVHGLPVHLFNFPRCTVPAVYRPLAPASISDWKRKYVDACSTCREKELCSGFFEWHPDDQAQGWISPL